MRVKGVRENVIDSIRLIQINIHSPNHGNVTKLVHICIEECYNIQNELTKNFNYDKIDKINNLINMISEKNIAHAFSFKINIYCMG